MTTAGEMDAHFHPLTFLLVLINLTLVFSLATLDIIILDTDMETLIIKDLLLTFEICFTYLL